MAVRPRVSVSLIKTSFQINIVTKLCSIISPMFLVQGVVVGLLPALQSALDFINLLGRAILIGLKPQSNNHTSQSASTISVPPLYQTNHRYIPDIYQGLSIFLKGTASAFQALTGRVPGLLPMVFQDNYADWFKVFRWLSSQPLLDDNPDDVYRESLLACTQIWINIGTTIGCGSQSALCSNPRCSGEWATLCCSQCLSALYCSTGCQVS
jgi:hypothetical protein